MGTELHPAVGVLPLIIAVPPLRLPVISRCGSAGVSRGRGAWLCSITATSGTVLGRRRPPRRSNRHSWTPGSRIGPFDGR